MTRELEEFMRRLTAIEAKLDEVLRYVKPWSVVVAEQQEQYRQMQNEFDRLNEKGSGQ